MGTCVVQGVVEMHGCPTKRSCEDNIAKFLVDTGDYCSAEAIFSFSVLFSFHLRYMQIIRQRMIKPAPAIRQEISTPRASTPEVPKATTLGTTAARFAAVAIITMALFERRKDTGSSRLILGSSL